MANFSVNVCIIMEKRKCNFCLDIKTTNDFLFNFRSLNNYCEIRHDPGSKAIPTTNEINLYNAFLCVTMRIVIYNTDGQKGGIGTGVGIHCTHQPLQLSLSDTSSGNTCEFKILLSHLYLLCQPSFIKDPSIKSVSHRNKTLFTVCKFLDTSELAWPVMVAKTFLLVQNPAQSFLAQLKERL